jgi:uncharacterized membrane protein YhaH (DUF805 family)
MSDELNKGQVEGAAQEAQEATPPPQYETPPQYQAQPQYGAPQQYEIPPMTGFGEAYKSYWRNYVNFNDRTSRAGYWWVVLANFIIEIVFYAIAAATLVGGAVASYYSAGSAFAAPFVILTGSAFGIIALIWGLANIIPGLAIVVRRLHDTGKSWVWILFALIPFAGGIIMIVFMAQATKYPPVNPYYGLPRQA